MKNFTPGNASFQGCISPKCLFTSQKENSCHIFKMAIVLKFFGDFMRHIIGQNADEKKK